MGNVIHKAGGAVLRALIPLLITLGFGLTAAKDLNGIKLQATAFAVGGAIAIFTALSVFVPYLSWRRYVSEAYAKYLDAITQAFVGTFFALSIGFLGAPEWANWRAALVGIFVGALNAVVRALQALLQPGEPVLDPVKEPKHEPLRLSTQPRPA